MPKFQFYWGMPFQLELVPVLLSSYSCCNLSCWLSCRKGWTRLDLLVRTHTDADIRLMGFGLAKMPSRFGSQRNQLTCSTRLSEWLTWIRVEHGMNPCTQRIHDTNPTRCNYKWVRYGWTTWMRPNQTHPKPTWYMFALTSNVCYVFDDLLNQVSELTQLVVFCRWVCRNTLCPTEQESRRGTNEELGRERVEESTVVTS